jgi:hypothetical protein
VSREIPHESLPINGPQALALLNISGLEAIAAQLELEPRDVVNLVKQGKIHRMSFPIAGLPDGYSLYSRRDAERVMVEKKLGMYLEKFHWTPEPIETVFRRFEDLFMRPSGWAGLRAKMRKLAKKRDSRLSISEYSLKELLKREEIKQALAEALKDLASPLSKENNQLLRDILFKETMPKTEALQAAIVWAFVHALVRSTQVQSSIGSHEVLGRLIFHEIFGHGIVEAQSPVTPGSRKQIAAVRFVHGVETMSLEYLEAIFWPSHREAKLTTSKQPQIKVLAELNRSSLDRLPAVYPELKGMKTPIIFQIVADEWHLDDFDVQAIAHRRPTLHVWFRTPDRMWAQTFDKPQQMGGTTAWIFHVKRDQAQDMRFRSDRLYDSFGDSDDRTLWRTTPPPGAVPLAVTPNDQIMLTLEADGAIYRRTIGPFDARQGRNVRPVGGDGHSRSHRNAQQARAASAA